MGKTDTLSWAKMDFSGTSTVVGQGLPVPLVDLALSGLLIDHGRKVCHTYVGTVHSGLKPLTGMLLSRAS